MAEDGWYSKYYKERINKHFSELEAKPKQQLKEKPKITTEFSRELIKIHPPTPSASRYLDYRKKEIQKIDADDYIEKPTSSSAQNIITPPKQPKFAPYYSKPYYRDFNKHEKIVAEPFEEKKPKPDPYQVLADVHEKIQPEKSDLSIWIIIGIIILIILIIIGVFYFLNMKPNPTNITNTTNISPKNTNPITQNQTNSNTNRVKIKFIPPDIITSNTSADSSVIYNGINLLTISGQESKLEYYNQTNNLYSINNKSGWFTNTVEISTESANSVAEIQTKKIFSNGESYIKNSELKFYTYDNKPYIKIQFSTDSVNNSNLGDFQYGLVIPENEVYSQSGVIYQNNKSNPTYSDNSDYQIFVNKDHSSAILVYSQYALMFNDLLNKNLIDLDVLQLDNGTYAPIYIIIIDNPNLSYNNDTQDWTFNSNQFKGNAMDYLDEIINEVGDKI